ncbi:MAG TPA: hypothetical protein VHR45_09150 [Thermoanaerobaculia bacterium]|nr:hypothetical protein [Thermoanaerobaculia bacterium]
MKRPRLAIALLIPLCSVLPAHSQPTGSDPLKEKAQGISADASEIGLAGTLPALLDGVAVEAGQANGKATINVTAKKLGNQSLVATLSTPVNKNSDSTDFASLDGLAPDLSLSLAYTGIRFSAQNQEVVDTEQRKVCDKYSVRKGECDQNGITRAAALSCKLDVASLSLAEVPNKVLQLRATAGFAIRTCLDARQKQALDEFDLASFRGGWRSPGSWAVAGELARKQTSFFQADGNKKKETELPYALSAAYGLIGGSSRFSVRGRYEWRFTDGKNARRCQPLPGASAGSGLESCEDLPFGAPAKSGAFVLSAEYRRWYVQGWAVSPILSYDFKKKVFGVQLPVYLVHNSDGQLTGGFRLGWRNDTHDLTASVFVTKPLSLGL